MIAARTVRFWLIRVLPLAAVGVVVIAIIPADFSAASKTMTVTAAAAAAVATRLPSPPVIPAGPLSIAPPGPKPMVGLPPQPTDTQPSVETAALEQPATAPAASPTAAPTDVAVVTSSGVNVRADANKDAAKLFVLPPGAQVNVAESVNGWVHVSAPEGSGWVYKSYLVGQGDAASSVEAAAPKPKSPASPLVGRTLQFSNGAAVLTSPSGEHVYDLDPGERVRIAEISGNWGRIETTDGESGWVRLR